jgi:cytochrome c551/c552
VRARLALANCKATSHWFTYSHLIAPNSCFQCRASSAVPRQRQCLQCSAVGEEGVGPARHLLASLLPGENPRIVASDTTYPMSTANCCCALAGPGVPWWPRCRGAGLRRLWQARPQPGEQQQCSFFQLCSTAECIVYVTAGLAASELDCSSIQTARLVASKLLQQQQRFHTLFGFPPLVQSLLTLSATCYCLQEPPAFSQLLQLRTSPAAAGAEAAAAVEHVLAMTGCSSCCTHNSRYAHN